MHNCKTTRERITELLLEKPDGHPGTDVNECEECREEFDALKETLRITARLFETPAPDESYWNGYHARLKQKLLARSVPTVRASGRSWLCRLFTYSIRVPVPIAVALLLVFALTLFFVGRRLHKDSSTPLVSVVHVPIEVPVIQEKVVTRVVYRQSKRHSLVRGFRGSADSPTLAKSQKVNAASLIGFRPLDEVRLTVIKGGTPDEK
jgi:hypothetical protein